MPEPEYPALHSDLVDLFEYKVTDVLAGRAPKGPKVGVRELREYLLDAPLDAHLMRRVRDIDKKWRAVQVTLTTPVATPTLKPLQAEQGIITLDDVIGIPDDIDTPDDGLLADTLSVSETGRNEWQILESLRETLYRFQGQQAAREQGYIWAKQKHLPTLRVALALAQVLESQSQPLQATSAGRAGLEYPSVAGLSYTDVYLPDKAALVLGALTQRLCAVLAEASGRVQLVHMALHSLSAQMAPGVLGVKVLKEEQHEQEALTHLLAKLLAHAQQGQLAQAAVTGDTQPLLMRAVSELSEYLECCVPHSLGGRGEELPLLGGLLYARLSALRLQQPNEGSLSLAIHLAGGNTAQWRGEELMWRRLPQEGGWEVVIGPPSSNSADFIRLSPQQPLAESRLGEVPVYLALLGDDLALSCVPEQHDDLKGLVQEAHLSAALLSPMRDYAALRLARAVAMALRSPTIDPANIDPAKVSPATAQAYRAAAAGELLAFARQGARTLLQAQHDPARLTQAFEAARGVGDFSPELLRGLLELLILPRALSLPRLRDLRSPAITTAYEHVVLPFRGEAAVRVLGQVLTLRMGIAGQVLASLPGQPAASVGELLILPQAQGSVLVVHMGERIVVGVQPAIQPE